MGLVPTVALRTSLLPVAMTSPRLLLPLEAVIAGVLRMEETLLALISGVPLLNLRQSEEVVGSPGSCLLVELCPTQYCTGDV